jgi:O-antigen/teichoic acid export membrane protein
MLQLATIGIVAGFLGPSDLGRYSLLLFLGALVTMIFSLAVKPGTIRRTFGGGDDDEDDDEDEEKTVSISPKHTLGAAMVWGTLLALLAAGLVVLLRDPLADLLLGGESDVVLVSWAALLGGAGILFKLTSITLWFERRPGSFLIVEIARPLIALALMAPLLASGGDLTDAVASLAIGTAAASVLAMVLLRSGFEPNFDPREVLAIIAGGGRRVPIVTSLWTIQNADIFLLSRFVDHADLGIYTLAAKLGLVASFLPQGFRVAMRPLRKSAIFKAVRSEYGRSTANGQLLAYFVLICISSILVMVLAGELVVDMAPPEFAAAAPLMPLMAVALVMAPMWRTMNGQTAWPGKSRAHFVIGTILAALTFIGLCLLLAPEIGIYAAPVAMLAAFAIPISYFFVRCQLGPNRIDFPYGEIARALVAAAVIGGGFHLLPSFHPVAQAAVIVVLLGLYVFCLFAFRVVPESHWPAISSMGTSVISGRGDRVNPRRVLRFVDAEDRQGLRAAVTERLAPSTLGAPALREDPPAREAATDLERTEGARLVRVLRLAGSKAGAPVNRRTRRDGLVGEFLFADEPVAVRNATMRRLLAEGAEAEDLRALEDLVEHLGKTPAGAWEGLPAAESGDARRRRAAGRRSREAMARAAKAIGRRI